MLDSRLIVFGSVQGMQHRDETTLYNVSRDSQKYADQIDELSAGSQLTSSSGAATGSCSAADDVSACETVTESNCVMLTSSDVLCYASVDEPTNIDENIVDFLLSLYWVLESKRCDRSCEHVDNLTLLTAPFEQRKDSSIADLDGRSVSFHFHMLYF